MSIRLSHSSIALRGALLTLAIGLTACDPGEVGPIADGAVRRDAGRDGTSPASDAADSTRDGTSPASDGGLPAMDASEARPDASGDAGGLMGPLRPEECGNSVDDDGDGEVDEGCNCVVGTERACYLGPVGTLNVGACRPGTQRCESAGARAIWSACSGQTVPNPELAGNGVDDDCNGMTDEPGARCLPLANEESGGGCGNGTDEDCDGLVDCMDPGCSTAARCMMMRCPTRTESVCFGGVDEDCDGMVDCADTDCAATPSCMPSPCPPGQTPTYTERVLTPQRGPSAIFVGDGQPVFPMTCVPGACPQGQVRVSLAGRPPVCVPPPPPCPMGQSPAYRGAGWSCEPPCELVIQYGYMFDFRRVCAPRPTITCPTGQSPTFDFNSERWVCRPTCDNTTYDRIILNGRIVCIPC